MISEQTAATLSTKCCSRLFLWLIRAVIDWRDGIKGRLAKRKGAQARFIKDLAKLSKQASDYDFKNSEKLCSPDVGPCEAPVGLLRNASKVSQSEEQQPWMKSWHAGQITGPFNLACFNQPINCCKGRRRCLELFTFLGPV